MKFSKKRCTLLLTVVVLFSNGLSAKNCDDLSGVWVSESGSKIVFSNSDGITLNGVYSLSPDVDPTPYPLVGYKNVKKAKPKFDNTVALSFVVHWGKLGSLSSWTGVCRVKNNVPSLETVVHQVRPVTRQANEHIHTSFQTYTLVIE